jgi:hypothetical protein
MPNFCAQPDKDAYIDAFAATTNYGTDAGLYFRTAWVGGTKTIRNRALATWQIPPEIKAAEVYKAYILQADLTPLTAVACSLYRVTATWTEAAVTWNSRNGVNNWGVAGGDVAEWTTPIDFTSLSAAGWLQIDVTTAVVEAINSYSSLFDILISLDAENSGVNSGEQGTSKDQIAAASWMRPYLLIKRSPDGQPVNV